MNPMEKEDPGPGGPKMDKRLIALLALAAVLALLLHAAIPRYDVFPATPHAPSQLVSDFDWPVLADQYPAFLIRVDRWTGRVEAGSLVRGIPGTQGQILARWTWTPLQ
jgi:hypothetical protein